MTVQNAIKILKTEYLGDSEYMELAKQMGAYALEKQIPKKANYPNEFQIKCPVCGTFVLDGQPYCDECGQALDWSD